MTRHVYVLHEAWDRSRESNRRVEVVALRVIERHKGYVLVKPCAASGQRTKLLDRCWYASYDDAVAALERRVLDEQLRLAELREDLAHAKKESHSTTEDA